jgi:lysophospholipase L1-like esterase
MKGFLMRGLNAFGLLILFGTLSLSVDAQTGETKNTLIPVNDPRIEIIGRTNSGKHGEIQLAFPGAGIRLRFTGATILLDVGSSTETAALTVVVDHGVDSVIPLYAGENQIEVAKDLPAAPHTIEIYKRTEVWEGLVTLKDAEISADSTLFAAQPRSARRLMMIGDSVTCGEGVGQNPTCTPDRAHPSSDAYNSYGMLMGRRLDAETNLVCYGGRGLVRDYRGFTKADNVLTVPQIADLALPMDEPKERVQWNPASWQPDVIFISVGTNDFNLEKTKPLDEAIWVGEYVKFLAHLRAEYPHAQIFVTEGAIVTDPLLAKMVKQAAADSHDSLVHYVASKHYVGYPCNAHPTGAEHRQMADDFEPILRSTLGW